MSLPVVSILRTSQQSSTMKHRKVTKSTSIVSVVPPVLDAVVAPVHLPLSLTARS